MDDSSQIGAIEELIAREAIRDCIYRYCRGIDRVDEAMLRSAYWPDGTDNHGAYSGSAAGFVDWAMKVLPFIERGIHHVHNVLIEFRAGGAAVESAFTAIQRQPDPDGTIRQWDMRGRYLDWFVERGGEWRVLNRLVVFDFVAELPIPEGSEAERFGTRQPIGSRWPDDPVYSFFDNR
ncbi:MAG TPA: nuclear transport factor 2 family protein [Novosphingobium sp.]|nr:nuclear transport factor 2 family protein [Novosphingobium sp.]HPZ46374.1 nuclear transport factor 2 family protein [Novosphingobium sp.]HQD98742.1 nuclear transport factor 2 family protein [Novosphingobium sp.]